MINVLILQTIAHISVEGIKLTKVVNLLEKNSTHFDKYSSSWVLMQ